ncbi:hypothetical protein MP228_003275 [Amoeboaphelidium protococcarum]|nr:hypothetical protein MP228_003275 [Amoeboaphelidium protococcarum]
MSQQSSEQELGIDLGQLKEYLHQQLMLNGEKQFRVKKFSQGQSNPTYLLECDGHKLVLRRKPHGKLLSQTAHNIYREFVMMEAMSTCNVPVPKMLNYCRNLSVIGTEFYLMQYVAGPNYKDVRDVCLSMPQNKNAIVDVYGSLISVLAKIHSVDVQLYPNLQKIYKPGSFYQRQIHTLGKVSQSQAQVIGAKLMYFDDLIDFYSGSIEQFSQFSTRSTVVHGDYKLDNCIFSSDEQCKVAAVLDWELSSVADYPGALSDLANLLLPFYIHGTFVGDMTGLAEHQGGLYSFEKSSASFVVPHVSMFLHKYCNAVKIIDYDRLEAIWPFCVSFSFFRMAVILQGIGARLVRGQASASDSIAQQYASYADPCCRIAWQIAQTGLEDYLQHGLRQNHAKL